MKQESIMAIHKASSNANQMHQDFTNLEKILRYHDHRFTKDSELSLYLEKRDNTKTSATAEWYYKIITIFHSASAILHNGKYHYQGMMTDIDMEELKEFLREKARFFLKKKVTPSTWAGQVRMAALKMLDLEELI
jgi:hypothetical protein